MDLIQGKKQAQQLNRYSTICAGAKERQLKNEDARSDTVIAQDAPPMLSPVSTHKEATASNNTPARTPKNKDVSLKAFLEAPPDRKVLKRTATTAALHEKKIQKTIEIKEREHLQLKQQFMQLTQP